MTQNVTMPQTGSNASQAAPVKKKKKTGLIIGLAAGGAALIALIVVLVIVFSGGTKPGTNTGSSQSLPVDGTYRWTGYVLNGDDQSATLSTHMYTMDVADNSGSMTVNSNQYSFVFDTNNGTVTLNNEDTMTYTFDGSLLTMTEDENNKLVFTKK